MHANLTMLAAAAASAVSFTCTQTSDTTADPEPICYLSQDGLLQSTLLAVAESGGERLLGVTELRGQPERERAQAPRAGSSAGARSQPGSVVRAVERANLDASGRLIRLDATLGAATGQPDAHVVLDPPHGLVEVTTPSLHIEWSVPNDLPWVWASLLTDPASRAPIATPLMGRVALRAGSAGAVRLLDLGALASHAIAADQIVVADGKRATVIIADDAIDLDEGTPSVVHVGSLRTTLEQVDEGNGSAKLAAAASCARPDWSAIP